MLRPTLASPAFTREHVWVNSVGVTFADALGEAGDQGLERVANNEEDLAQVPIRQLITPDKNKIMVQIFLVHEVM